MPVLVAVLLGSVFGLVGLALLLPLPELGLPMLLGGLRLLGRRFAWARRANASVDRVAHQVMERYRRLPVLLRISVVAGVAALVVILLVIALQHGPW